MDLQGLDERFDRDAVEPVIEYVNNATGIEWLSVGENQGQGTRYISNVKMRTWQGQLAGVYALLYIGEIALARGIDGRSELRNAWLARRALAIWLDKAGPLENRTEIRDKATEVKAAGRSEGHPKEERK